MLNLSDREWKTFDIGQLFVVKRPKARSEKVYMDGKIPFVASGNTNNGVIRCCEPSINEKLDDGDCITVSPVDGSAFYQKSAFLGRGGAGSSILMLYSDNINKYSGLFLARMIRQTCSKYCYGKMGNQDGIKKEKILLPVTAEGLPDYAFMEAYIKEREKKLLTSYINHIKSTIGNDMLPPPIKQATWCTFALTDIFTVKATSSSIDKIKLIKRGGAFPYITRTETTNGINSFVCKQPCYSLDEGNCITIGLDTQTAYYQEQAFYTGQNIQILRSPYLNKINALFLLPLLRQMLSVFSWGSNGATLTRLRRCKILLPTTSEGLPDWDFMERYGRALEARLKCAYLKRIEALQQWKFRSLEREA